MINSNASRLQELYARIHATFREKPHSPAHHAACEEFRTHYDALAFPGGLRLELERLKRLDLEMIEPAVQFLEEDPWYQRSGYIKEEMLRRLKHAPLSRDQRFRLASLVVRSMVGGAARVFIHYSRLAPVLGVSSIVSTAAGLGSSDDAEHRRRATHIIAVLKTRGVTVPDR